MKNKVRVSRATWIVCQFDLPLLHLSVNLITTAIFFFFTYLLLVVSFSSQLLPVVQLMEWFTSCYFQVSSRRASFFHVWHVRVNRFKSIIHLTDENRYKAKQANFSHRRFLWGVVCCFFFFFFFTDNNSDSENADPKNLSDIWRQIGFSLRFDTNSTFFPRIERESFLFFGLKSAKS